MTGLDLKLRRVAADVKAQDVASAMRVSTARVSRIETSRLVTDQAASRYLAALDMCVTKSKDSAA